MRLRVRISKGLTTPETVLSVRIADRDVTISSQKDGEPLREAKWIVFRARGFSTEGEATGFGTDLRQMLELASLSTRLGVDTGKDEASTWVSEEFARAIGAINEGQTVRPNVHGLSVFPDDDNIRIPSANIELTVTASAEYLLSALNEIGQSRKRQSAETRNSIRLLNMALLVREPLAQMVLSLSAIEDRAQNQNWTESQRELVSKLSQLAEESDLATPDERAEVAHSIRTGLFRLSIRQRVKRLLSANQLGHLGKDWDRLYGIRSGLFHGTSRLTDHQISEAASETMTLCGRIVLKILEQEGVTVPAIGKRMFFGGSSGASSDIE